MINPNFKPGERIPFLDMEIVNTGDGLVLSRQRYGIDDLWTCHLGNFGSLDDAKHAAIVYWMIARPWLFHATLLLMSIGKIGTYHSYSTFADSVQKEGYAVPDEVVPSVVNGCIKFKGMHLNQYYNDQDKH